MATTTNFGWETPDDTDLVKDGAAAIRTALGGVDTSFVDLKGGTTGQILSKASNTDLDFSWASNGFTYTNWTPTFTNLTVGNGTLVGRYAQSGKLVHAWFKLTFGSTSAVSGNTTITLPVNAASSGGSIRGTGAILDAGVRWFTAFADINGTSQATIVAVGANLNNAYEDYLSSTVPMTWTTNDVLAISFTYEAA